MDVIVYLSKALICIAGQCFPALVGTETPTGTFTMYQRITEDPLYRGSVLQFHETPKMVLAIHRIWLGRPTEKRQERLASSASQRFITKGCINVSDDVYNQLLHYQGQPLRIEP